MVDKFCLRIFSFHEVPKLWGKFHFLGGKSVITDWRNLCCNYYLLHFFPYLTEVAREVGSDRAPNFFLFHPKFRHLMG